MHTVVEQQFCKQSLGTQTLFESLDVTLGCRHVLKKSRECFDGTVVRAKPTDEYNDI